MDLLSMLRIGVTAAFTDAVAAIFGISPENAAALVQPADDIGIFRIVHASFT